MSQWTNEYDIHQDLSLIQGRVPVSINGTLGAGDRPPTLDITEETEEEFYKHGSADADVGAAPDLGLIKKMLDMVRDFSVSSDEDDVLNKEDVSKKVVIINKLHPKCSESTHISVSNAPQEQSPKKNLDETKKKEKPKQRIRNVAIESIQQAIAGNRLNVDKDSAHETIKLLKPDDFIAKNENETSDLVKSNLKMAVSVNSMNDAEDVQDNVLPTVSEKITGWFETQLENPLPKKAPKVLLEPVIMFKRKTVAPKVEAVESPKSVTSSNSGEYKPSTLANEYYQKYLEQNKFKQSVKEDIWTKAQKKMQEIDEKRKQEMIVASTSQSSPSQELENGSNKPDDLISGNTESPGTDAVPSTNKSQLDKCLGIVSLSQHRHQMAEECIVCEVILKKQAKDVSDSDVNPLLTQAFEA